MKRIFALILIMVALCVMLVSCDEDDEGEEYPDLGSVEIDGNSFGVDFEELFGSVIVLPDEEL